MPVQVVCPSCATQLNIRDEHAGRPVKCPKCSFVIPPAQAPAPPPLPPVPTPPADAGGSPLSARPTAKPAASRPPRDRDDDDDDRDRPKKRKPRRDDDDDDDRPRERPAKGKSNTPIILAILGFMLLACCGGAGYGIYYVTNKVKEKAEEVREWAENTNLRVNRQNYESLKEGMTPAEVEIILGPGKLASAEQTTAAFPEMNRARAGDWSKLASEGRVVIWRNGKDHILCGFHPAVTNGRLQMKTWQPGGGISAEQKFASDEEAARPGWGKKKETLPAIEIAAWNLAKTYKDNPGQGDRNYKGRALIVSGLVHDITMREPNEVLLTLVNPPPAEPPGLKVSCLLKADAAKSIWRHSRGQSVKIRGICEGVSRTFVNLTDATVENAEADPSLQVQAAPFFNEFDKDMATAEEKYDGKSLTLLSFVVVRREGNSLILTSPKSKWTVKATFPADLKSQLDNAKVGGRATVKGEFSSVSGNEISVNRCWLVP
jgi:hypothetical protein